MISHTVSISDTSPQPMATFVYDGNGNRVQQTDSSGSQPTTTTYINDVVGLTQVLVADDGTSQVYNLFGLDLIAQDDATNTRTMLADGLGSVRTELVGGTVESTSTYDPYGNLLQQTAVSGTTYGYTGEQQDSSTGLLYLRARYYNPALRMFMGRDPWSGNVQRSQSMNGWSYVENNPSNLTDSTGMFPDWCKTATTDWWYADCVRTSYLLGSPWSPWLSLGIWPSKLDDHKYNGLKNESGILGAPGCYYGAVPYRGSGYVEGIDFTALSISSGREVVYDFATFERSGFEYLGGSLSLTPIGYSFAQSVGKIKGFRSWKNIKDDYSGLFQVSSIGVGLSTPGFIALGVSTGKSEFFGVPNFHVHGSSWFVSIGLGLDLNPAPVDISPSIGGLNYWANTRATETYLNNGEVLIDSLVVDILNGNDSPLYSDLLYTIGGRFKPNGINLGTFLNPQALIGRATSAVRARWYADIYDDMHGDTE